MNDVTAQPNKKKITNASGGSSYHNHAIAVDLVEIQDGVALWNYPNEDIISEVAQKYGIEWGGNWTSFTDKPHFQITNGNSISDLKNGADPCDNAEDLCN